MIVEPKYIKFDEQLSLESGKTLSSYTLAYETYGELNERKDNAILVCHALSGDAHAAGKYTNEDKKPGWWDFLIGEGKVLDTNKYFVICSNVIGSCRGSTGPASINPETDKQYGLSFPFVTISDMVRAQVRLVDYFEIDKLFAVIGGSMGGMQALTWAKEYGGRLRNCIPIATSLYQSAQNIGLHEVGTRSILSDPYFYNGDYYSRRKHPDSGLAIARMLGHITYLSDEAMRKKFGRKLQNLESLSFDMNDQFQIESYLGYQGRRFIERFDANSYLYITRAIDYFDIGFNKPPKDVFPKIDTSFLVISFSSDWLYPPYQVKEIAAACKARNIPVTYYDIESEAGHDAFLLRNEMMESLIKSFLDASYEELQNNTKPNAVEDIERIDYRLINTEIPSNSRVLDLGCGDGTLLEILWAKNCRCEGVEYDAENFLKAVKRGISVIEGDINYVLQDYEDNSFDYVVLNLSLQVTTNSKKVLEESLRIGRKVIVSFPNFSYIENLLWLFVKGKMPKTEILPFDWHETPNIHLLTINDFSNLCTQENYTIHKAYHYTDRKLVHFMPRLLAQYSMFILEK